MRAECERTTLILHGKLKVINDDLKRCSRISLIELNETSSAQPTSTLLACHIRDVEILLATIRESDLRNTGVELQDERALLDAASSLADSVDPYLPGCAVLLRGVRTSTLEATLGSLQRSIESMVRESGCPWPSEKSPKRVYGVQPPGVQSSGYRAPSNTLPNLVEHKEIRFSGESDRRASLETLVVHDLDLKKTSSLIK